ncbi:MAG: LysM peptidoglycan-binding domain-containing protein [Candidatus Binatia bacterium]
MVEKALRGRTWLAKWRLLLLSVTVLFPVAALADPSDFPKPAALVVPVDFWKKAFADWSEHQVAIHDDLYLDKVYSVVDLRPLAASGASDNTLYRERKRRTEAEKIRIDGILGRIHAKGGRPEALSADERAVWELLRDLPGEKRFLAARGRLRAQQGLKERFQRGIEISRRYLPHMEAVFRREGLPIELTRLPFVESSFNVKAYSKVGAAGIWQFIPSSARIYRLKMNEVVDDRRDPLLATEAAARHLRDDFAVLGAWPLAVTAYNHGRAGVARAVREVGSRDIATIVHRYRGRSFRFASRNFYASFLAALEVERDHEKHFGPLRFEPKLEFEEVLVGDYVSFSTLARLAETNVEGFHELNPAFERVVVEGRLYVPKGYAVRVPAARASSFRTAYAGLPASERFAAQRQYAVEHRVASGQTIGAIARRYGSSTSAIQAANNLRSAHRIRIGQVLKIPTGRGQVTARIVASTAEERPAARSVARSHRVRPGETLASIAKRYGTTVSAIQSANALRSAHRIRAGQLLRIPGRSSGTTPDASYVRHRVAPGQTVGAIARRYGTTVSAIQAANELPSVHAIRPGQILKIPPG